MTSHEIASSNANYDQDPHEGAFAAGPGDLIIAFFFLSVAVAIVGYYVWYEADTSQRASLALTGLIGATMGWATGIALTPYGNRGPARIGTTTKIVLAILFGFAIAKVDDIASLISNQTPTTISASSGYLAYCGVGAALFVVSLATTYIARCYGWARRIRLTRDARIAREAEALALEKIAALDQEAARAEPAKKKAAKPARKKKPAKKATQPARATQSTGLESLRSDPSPKQEEEKSSRFFERPSVRLPGTAEFPKKDENDQ